MGFHAGFIAVENEQISLTAVSDLGVCGEQSGSEFEQELNRCVVCGGRWFIQLESSHLCSPVTLKRDLWISAFESAPVLSVRHSRGYYYLCHGLHNLWGWTWTHHVLLSIYIKVIGKSLSFVDIANSNGCIHLSIQYTSCCYESTDLSH